MIALPRVEHCRLSGEPLADAPVLFELTDCPVPGIYPATAAEAAALRSPLRVVQAVRSGFVQLAHAFDGALYGEYAFAGGGSAGYRRHLEAFADRIAAAFPAGSSLLEVGCGDGHLVRLLRARGYDALGIDPSRAARDNAGDGVVCGFFPQDLPASHRGRKFDLIYSRHVLEHIEAPRPFVAGLADALAPQGQLWIEVPDLDATVTRGLWSNFYQLHCNYFSALTLDRLLGDAGLRCLGGELVDIFGGSLLRRYAAGNPPPQPPPPRLTDVGLRVAAFGERLEALTAVLPAGTVGYGAAERTAMTLGLVPALAGRLAGLYDGNPLLTGRFLAGTDLRIAGRDALWAAPPPAIVLFALSNRREILAEWRGRLPDTTLIGIAGDDFAWQPLGRFA